MLKMKDLRSESSEELDVKHHELSREIYTLRSQQLDAKDQKKHLIRQKKREIARILTLKKERQLEERKE
jgi:large subunit ribosomal protein L29